MDHGSREENMCVGSIKKTVDDANEAQLHRQPIPAKPQNNLLDTITGAKCVMI